MKSILIALLIYMCTFNLNAAETSQDNNMKNAQKIVYILKNKIPIPLEISNEFNYGIISTIVNNLQNEADSNKMSMDEYLSSELSFKAFLINAKKINIHKMSSAELILNISQISQRLSIQAKVASPPAGHGDRVQKGINIMDAYKAEIASRGLDLSLFP